MHELYKVLGLFIPLIVTNCAILGRVESFASKQPVVPAMLDGFAMGIGFTWVLVLLGAMREFFGSGTLFADASLLLGGWASAIEMTIFPEYGGTLLLILPPGGFICLGLMLAGKRVIDRVLAARRAAQAEPLEGSLEGAA
jgi:electron transport complex protein RnfE